VVLGDLSFEALEVANQNIERHGVDERVYTVQGDGSTACRASALT